MPIRSQKPVKDILAIIDGRLASLKRVKTKDLNQNTNYTYSIDNISLYSY